MICWAGASWGAIKVLDKVMTFMSPLWLGSSESLAKTDLMQVDYEEKVWMLLSRRNVMRL